MGITVVQGPAAGSSSGADAASGSPRKLTLVMARDTRGPATAFGFAVTGDRVTPAAGSGRISSPGPVLVLRRNEPVEITVTNHLGERTALHWHGMELDSIYDGVHGWSGRNQNLAPLIEPDGSSSFGSRRRERGRSCTTRICTTSVSCRWGSTARWS